MPLAPLLDKVKTTIKRHQMLLRGDSVLIGLSGGPDSVCLLCVLDMLKESFDLRLSAIYIDHGLRPGETDVEREFCRKLCGGRGVRFIEQSIDVRAHANTWNLNLQEAARQLRYWTFDQTAREIKAHRIALGHTADDQAETLVMNLLRGTGPTGLAGMPPVRKNIIRPLIDVERREIEAFLDANGVGFLTDSSNLKRDYVRNRVRLSLMPRLREFNLDIIGTLARTAAIFQDEERYFTVIVTKTLMKMISRKTDTRLELFLAPFEIMDTVVMRRALRRAIDETRGLRRITYAHIEDVIRLIKEGKPGDRIYLPDGIRVIKDYSTLILTSEAPSTLTPCALNVPGETILKESGILLKASEAGVDAVKDARDLLGDGKGTCVLDADALPAPLMARPRRPGDFFYPRGFGRRKKLQDYFVDEKVPRDERNRIPIVTSGDEIVWVVGYRADERFKVTGKTKRIVTLEVKKIRD